MERGQFTFYRSFWEAASRLSKKDRLAVLEAVITFGLDGQEPENLTQAQMAYFMLAKPILQSGRSKAESGKLGGVSKANGKQTGSKIQDKIKTENKVKKELKTQTKGADSPGENVCRDSFFEAFWEGYPWKVGRQEALEAWHTLDPDEKTSRQILTSLDGWKKTPRWQNEGGRYIPSAAKYLLQEYWKNVPQPPAAKEEIPKGATGELGQVELENIQRLLRETDFHAPCGTRDDNRRGDL